MNARFCFAVFALVVVGFIPARAAESAAKPPRVFFLIGEPEYDTKTTVPAFAKAELEPRGVQCTYSILPSDESNDFPNIEGLKDADLLFISVRRHTPTQAEMKAIRAFVAAGKPVVGIRTASHAFALRGKDAKPAAGYADWPEFDHEILGGNYSDHYGKGIETWAKVVPTQVQHPVVAGIGAEEFSVPSHLYKNPGLPDWVTPLMTARLANRPEVEPIAWVNTKDGRRVFYTSLGAPEDFALPQFRKLLLNGVFWALGRAVPVPNTDPTQKLRPGQTTAAALTPSEAMQTFTVAKDLVLEQVMAEPEVIKPLFINFDERGRMWVVEYRQYPEPAGLKVLSHDSYWRSVYDKVSPPPPHQFKGRDRITIHESTKGDGVYDKHTVFLDGLNICTAVERGRGGVWVLNPPYLLFYPTKNGGDVPDGDPVVHLAGFGLEDTHSVANSLRWGPDGWLYGAHGSTVTASITRPGIDKEPIANIEGQAIWRYQPETRRFEVFCEGGGNTFGVEIDSKGRIFSGHNGGDTRGFHYMQGAYLRKGFDKHGPLSNPYTFGYFDAMQHEKVQRFSHTFLIYEGGAMSAAHTGHLFGPEPLQNQVVETEITPVGSTFKTHDLQRPVTSRDPWFRPVDIKAGPDGAIYLCDWYVPQLAHSRTYSDLQQGPLDLARGRIYRLREADASTVTKPFDFSKQEALQLVDDLRSENKWVRQTVQRVIADRHDAAIVPELKKRLDANEGQYALELLWALHGSGGFDEAAAMHLLDHRDAFVRMWTARLLGDGDKVSPAVAKKLADAAEHETDVEARAQMACTAKRLPAAEDLPVVRALMDHDADAADPRVPLLLWWAIEAKVDSDRDAVLTMFRESPLWDRPIVKEQLLDRLMRRFAQTGARKDLLTCATLFDMAPTNEHSQILMKGFEVAFKGRPLNGLPEELVTSMRRHGVGSVALSLRQGDAGAVDKALKVIADEKAPAQTRLEYVTILGEVKAPASVPVLLDLVEKTKDEPLRKAALAALSPYEDAQIATRVIADFPQMGKDSKAAAFSLLASRAGSAALLVKAVEGDSIPHGQVPLEIVRKIKLFTDHDLPARTEKIWGSAGRSTTAEMTAKIQKLGVMLRGEGTGDPYEGKKVFMGTCGACHTLHGQGGQVGPDLTKYKRDDLDSLLLNIVNPSAEIREGYENFLVTTHDGRILNGFLVEQDPQVVVLRGLDGQNVSLPRSQIADLKNAGVSLMPEGLLDTFTDQQVRDLFAYLRTSQPLLAK